MEQNVKPFEEFYFGSHLILGEAGSGKTKLIWSILEDREYVKENSINIVLTDSDKRMWSSNENSIKILNPYESDISWATNPSKPGIYYCACDYAPRIITFLECIATWAIQNENKMENKVRVFIDISSKIWALPDFIEQVNRLHFIATSQEAESPVEIWAVLGNLKKIPSQARTIFSCTNLILMNPISQAWVGELKDIVGLNCGNLGDRLDDIEIGKKAGYYYAPTNGQDLYIMARQEENRI